MAELNELQTKWLTALRDGERQQCRGALSKVLDGSEQKGFCCLGVFADVRGVSWDLILPGERHLFTLDDKEYNNYLPELWLGELGLTYEDQMDLIQLNDGERLSFSQIADKLEAFWRRIKPLIVE